ncbi:unnamed protein product [Linum tenue]|uniref:Aminotransferase-like plant mobile domain-containing protein n=1 Tax=Linum tenue TaxID=586396 RepID=A0AAV0QHQ9_9ROSI|nr:unnamed protein product [Linum tenue]
MARLESIRHFEGIKVDRQLITALVERWRKETHCFKFREGECTITLKDVAILTHLPIDGKAVCVSDHPPRIVTVSPVGSISSTVFCGRKYQSRGALMRRIACHH